MIFIFQQTFLGFTMKAHYEKGHSFELRKAFQKLAANNTSKNERRMP